MIYSFVLNSALAGGTERTLAKIRSRPKSMRQFLKSEDGRRKKGDRRFISADGMPAKGYRKKSAFQN
jgi:hypothetical protein